MRRCAAPVVIAVVIASLLAVAPGAAAQDDPFGDDTVFVDGSGSPNPRIGVALQLSRATFGDGGAEAVLIGRDDVFADSLASGVMQSQGPLLLVPRDGPVPQPVLDEIARVGAGRAWVLGGESAIAPAVVAELEAAGLMVERLAGPGRVETAVAVAARAAPEADTAILAREGGTAGDPTSGFADALAAGGWAAATGWPVLLTASSALSTATADHLRTSPVSRIMIVGGTAAIGPEVEQAVRDLGLEVQRVAGAGRAATAIEVAKARGVDTAGDAVGFVVVEGFTADAWAAGFASAAISARGPASDPAFAQASATGLPIVLATLDDLPPETREWLTPAPETAVCAVPEEVCERARLEVGFAPALTPGSVSPDPDLLPEEAWADAVVAYEPGTGFAAGALEGQDPAQALGPADCEDATTDSVCIVSLGNGGSLVLAFTDRSITGDGDESTAELFLYEVGQRAEATRLTLIEDGGSTEVELFDGTGGGACGTDPTALGEDAFTLEGQESAVDVDCWLQRAGIPAGVQFDRVRITDVASEMATSNRPTPGADIDALAAR